MWQPFIFLLLSIISSVQTYSQGAPDSACKNNLEPMHGKGVAGQKGPSPYMLDVSQTDYMSNENITVILKSLSGNTTFKGFLIMAIKAPTPEDGSSTPKTVGKLTADASSSWLRCNESALTHTDAEDKESISFTWKAPDVDVGPVVFRYTVVRDKGTYWANTVSEAIVFYNETTEDVVDGVEWGDLSEDQYEYWDGLWVEEDFDDPYPDDSSPNVTETVGNSSSTSTGRESGTQEAATDISNTQTATDNVSKTQTTDDKVGNAQTVNENVIATTPVAANENKAPDVDFDLSVTPVNSINIGEAKPTIVNADSKDIVKQDLTKLTGVNLDMKQLQSNEAKDLPGDKMNKDRNLKLTLDTQKAMKDNAEDIQPATEAVNKGNRGSRLAYSLSLSGLSLIGIALLNFL